MTKVNEIVSSGTKKVITLVLALANKVMNELNFKETINEQVE